MQSILKQILFTKVIKNAKLYSLGLETGGSIKCRGGAQTLKVIGENYLIKSR
jgi:hypothetical protein